MSPHQVIGHDSPRNAICSDLQSTSTQSSQRDDQDCICLSPPISPFTSMRMEESIEELDRVRVQLEENVKKLQVLLRHWRTEEADYEGLKEGLKELTPEASDEEIRKSALDCSGELVTVKEIKTLIEDGNGVRELGQIIGLIDRRIDYVQQNVKTMEKRLESEQEKLNQANFIGHRDESGLPLMEITEQLDDEDNVISSSVVRPSEAAPQLLDVLRRGGIKDNDSANTTESVSEDPPVESRDTESPKVDLPPSNFSEKGNVQGTPAMDKRKKSVTFQDAPQIREIESTKDGDIPRQVRVADDLEIAGLDPVVDPVIPENENAEDAALRREMLEYSMRDIGTIVAEMDVDGDYDSDEDDDGEDEDEEYEEEDEFEDEFGRTTVPVITEKYRAQMLALEKRLNAKALINVGQEATEVATSRLQEDNEVKPLKSSMLSESKPAEVKGVRFAEELDVQELPVRAPMRKEEQEVNQPIVKPLADEIVERAPVEVTAPGPAKKKLSRFKASRMNDTGNEAGSNSSAKKTSRFSQEKELYPKDVVVDETPSSETLPDTIGSTVVEKLPEEIGDVREPDNLDPELHTAEIRNAYHQLRNKMIQRENGFLDQDMEEYEDEHGRPQISRFRAARLASQKKSMEGRE